MPSWVLLTLLASGSLCRAQQPVPSQTPAESPDLAVGKKIFESQCALCHGQTGGGGRGPSLNRPKLNKAPDDPALRKVISDGIDPEMPGAWQLHPHEVASVAAYVRSLGTLPPEKLPGNPAHGRTVYDSHGCAACHMISGHGEGYGPELTTIGARRNGAHLRQAVQRPAEAIPEDFLYVSLTTAAGETVRGIRVNEDSFSIQLKDAAGRFYSFRKAELAELRRLPKETPMPSFERVLSASDLDDLVAYLAALRGEP
jgi:cytochrome c oxidase cbb3-type subunit III